MFKNIIIIIANDYENVVSRLYEKRINYIIITNKYYSSIFKIISLEIFN